MVFARSTGDKLARLVKTIDALVADNSDKKLASFVNILGDNADTAAAAAAKFADDHQFENVAICVAEDLPDGPVGFKIAPEADVTVIGYINTQVEDNQVFGPGQTNREQIEAVVAGTKKILAGDDGAGDDGAGDDEKEK
jgi:hypothetical protein